MRGGATVDEADFFEALVCAERCEEWRALLGRGGAGAGAAARELAGALEGGGPLAGAYADEARRGGCAAALERLLEGEAGSPPGVAEAARAALDALARREGGRRSWALPGAPAVQVFELGDLGSAGVAGRVWAAAPALCAALGEWGRTLVEGRAVLELGCGCGVCAVFCAAELGAARVVATDSSAAALDCLRETLEGLCTPSVATRVETRFLEWGDCAPTTSAASGAGSDAAATAAASAGRQGAHLALSAEDLFPFIVGSDLLYEPAAAKSLPWAVKRHLAPGGRALLCLKNRSSRNLAAFEANALSAGLRLGHRRAAEAPEAAALERRALSGASPSARESSDGGHVLVALELAGEPNSPWERVSCDAPGFEWREVGRLAGT